MAYITDLTHFLDESGQIGPPPGPGRLMGSFIASIVSAASPLEPDGLVQEIGVFCIQRPDSECEGQLRAGRTPEGEVIWVCPACQESGTVSGWMGTRWDARLDPDADWPFDPLSLDDDTHEEWSAESPFDGDPDELTDMEYVQLAVHMERTLHMFHRMAREVGAESEEELDALAVGLRDGTQEITQPTEPYDRAMELVYEAWSKEEPIDRLYLAQQAVDLSPDCADAFILLSEDEDLLHRNRRALREQALAAGKRLFPESHFHEQEGAFWHIFETRPYMRARMRLAECLWDQGEAEEAIEHLEAMLRLNLTDDQGLRHRLAEHLACLDRHTELDRLLDDFPDDLGTDFSYWRLLRAFASRGDSKYARDVLALALEANAHVPHVLLGQDAWPELDDEGQVLGSAMEAVEYAAAALGSWQRTPGALRWLMEEEG